MVERWAVASVCTFFSGAKAQWCSAHAAGLILFKYLAWLFWAGFHFHPQSELVIIKGEHDKITE